MLANVTIGSQVQKEVFKGCKNGLFYALDASTGKLLWSFNPPSTKFTPYTTLFNPLDPSQMKKPWGNYPSTAAYLQNPGPTGGIESDPAFDPTTGLVYVATYNAPTWMQAIPVSGHGVAYGVGGSSFPTGVTEPVNTTIWALNAGTGKPVWNYPINNIGYRGGITVSGGILYVPRQDGYLTLLDSSTGAVIRQFFVGSAMITQPALATDANGAVHIVMPASDPSSTGNVLIGGGIPASSPGFIFALGLGQTNSATTTSPIQTGVDPNLFYATAGAAVVLAMLTGYLAIMRRKK
jgi:alcohol dehydrogenase (cytochrome c)